MAHFRRRAQLLECHSQTMILGSLGGHQLETLFEYEPMSVCHGKSKISKKTFVLKMVWECISNGLTKLYLTLPQGSDSYSLSI